MLKILSPQATGSYNCSIYKFISKKAALGWQKWNTIGFSIFSESPKIKGIEGNGPPR